MDKPAFNGHCDKCNLDFSAIPKQSLLGFLKMSCPLCNKELLYPLSMGYRIVYWILVAFSIFATLPLLSGGTPRAPGIMGIAAMFALAYDWKIRKQTRKMVPPS